MKSDANRKPVVVTRTTESTEENEFPHELAAGGEKSLCAKLSVGSTGATSTTIIWGK
jgi:hypothetical protein